MNNSKYLSGGRENQIIKIGNTVHRPTGRWTKQIHELLLHLRQSGFYAAPEPLGFDEQGREIVSFIEGDVSNYPLSPNASSIKALVSAALLLRSFHDTTQSFLETIIFENTDWQLPARQPYEVICHGDYAPYNIVLDGEVAVGIIDFDTCHPGPRVWDIAYALYRWCPFTNPKNQDGFGCIQEQIKRARLFCRSYGLADEKRLILAELMVERLQKLVDFMFSQADLGDETYKLNIKNEHHLLYLEDIKYIKNNLIAFVSGITD
ncbi:phosphotransferase enzyme family protein [Legionella sp. km772]|uniref:phosphotransferase enzyme family protein n=1 Tax=Legionella sp. km772 TaxID=2498111 RepID=UPI000F8F24BA|nr:aminoglycoside phosphotransferase family protein [Legionella sp. km772]RUR04982.1 aminoglycoside phosphotransferase family protein [Legionella sp. km772]